jgi:hypothetical protein
MSHLLDILKTHPTETLKFIETGELEDTTGPNQTGGLYDTLYDYYSNNGEMPYGVAKADTGDPVAWIGDRLADELASPYKGWEMYKFLIQLPRLVKAG